MIFDRNIWGEPFSKSNSPNWNCSTCDGNVLVLDKDTLHSVETRESSESHAHDAWDPQWIRMRFVAIFRCNNLNCLDSYIVSGSGRVDEIYIDGYNDKEYIEF